MFAFVVFTIFDRSFAVKICGFSWFFLFEHSVLRRKESEPLQVF